MFKKQLKFQRIVCFVTFICCVLCFVYALGMLTDLYKVCEPAFDNAKAEEALIMGTEYFGEFKGASLYFDMQGFNRLLIKISAALLVISLLLFITSTHSRRKYYVTNYIATFICAACAIGVSLWSVSQVAEFRAIFVDPKQFDLVTLKVLAEAVPNEFTYSDSTFWFDISFVIYGCTIISSLLLLANLVFKIVVMNGEKKLLKMTDSISAETVSVGENK